MYTHQGTCKKRGVYSTVLHPTLSRHGTVDLWKSLTGTDEAGPSSVFCTRSATYLMMSQYRRLTHEQDPMLNGSTTDEEWCGAQFVTGNALFDSGSGWSNSSSGWDTNGMANSQQGFDPGFSPDALSTGTEAYLMGPFGHSAAFAAGGTGMSS